MDLDHAVVVGINDYPSPQLSRLNGAVRDAKLFAEWLQKSDGGDLPRSRIHLITSRRQPGIPVAAAKPARGKIIEAL